MKEKHDILFGKVVDVKDEEMIHRVRCTIQGYTEQIPVDDLPWYFPFYGVNFLPQVDDVVPVIIFDNNFTSGFYGRKIDTVSRELSEDDYENYLEIFKRAVGDANVQLTYTPSLGIQFINGDTSQQMEIDKLTFLVKENRIFMDEKVIELGTENLEASLLGDQTVKYLKEQIKLSDTIKSQAKICFDAIATAAMGSPFTANIGAALKPLVPIFEQMINMQKQTCERLVETIQSKKVFNE